MFHSIPGQSHEIKVDAPIYKPSFPQTIPSTYVMINPDKCHVDGCNFSIFLQYTDKERHNLQTCPLYHNFWSTPKEVDQEMLYRKYV